jgi:Right handed beta helix region
MKIKPMKIVIRLSYLLSAALGVLCCGNKADAQGASTPFISYEAESGKLGGGATIVALTSPSTTEFSSPQLEASGHAYVNLATTGQNVLFTNNTGQAITTLNIRYSIPDSSGGGGISNTIDLYVGGTLRGAIPVNSFQTWVYESSTNYNGMSQSPSAGNPHVFWDEVGVFVPGGSIPAGATFSLQKDSANSASYYNIDVVDLESPTALSQPANSISIMSYGAESNNPSFDNSSALQSCFNAAENANKIAWIPPGEFYISSGGALEPNSVTIQGAGPWYSAIICTKANWANGFMIHGNSASFLDLRLDATLPDSTPGMFAILANGGNWTIDNVWARHTMLVWGSGTNATVENSRVNNSWGDGMNINNVVGQICTNILIYNNFSRGNGDDAIAVNSANTSEPPVQSVTVKNNTTVASWWANQLGIYGGKNILIEDNLFEDCVKKTGIELSGYGGPVVPVDVTVQFNTILRGGSFGYGLDQPAIIIEGDGTNDTVNDNTINKSMFEAVQISTGTYNLQFEDNLITAPGTTGIIIPSGTTGTGTFLNNMVESLNSGQSAYINNAPSTFAATLVSNSWPVVTMVNDNDPGITYVNWAYSSGRGVGDFDNDVHYSTTVGATAQYTFTGTGVSYIAEKNNDEGNVDVYIDNVFQANVNLNVSGSRQVQQVVYSNTGLASGSHTIKLVNKSTAYGIIDAFEIF